MEILMAAFIKSILIFTLLVTVMKGLINSDSFRMYFKFFSGLVLILVMLGPLADFLSGGSRWYSLLEHEIFKFNMDWVNDELEIADGKFEEIVREGCKEDIKEKVRKLAENRNIDVKDIDVLLSDKNGPVQVASVGIVVNKDKKGNGNNADTEGEVDIQEIKDIDIGPDSGVEVVDAMSDDGGRREASGENIRKLKEDISSYFIIKETAVDIWE